MPQCPVTEHLESTVTKHDIPLTMSSKALSAFYRVAAKSLL